MIRVEGSYHFKKSQDLEAARAVFLEALKDTFVDERTLGVAEKTLTLDAQGPDDSDAFDRICDALYTLAEKARAGQVEIVAPGRGGVRYLPGGWSSLSCDELPEGAARRIGSLRFVSGLPLLDVAFAPDGGRLATAGALYGAARVWLWDAKAGRLLREIRAHEQPEAHHGLQRVSIDFSPDGALVVSGSFDGYARVWETSTGREIAAIRHGDAINRVTWSKSHSLIATLGGSGEVAIWDGGDFKLARRIDTGKKYLRQIAFGPEAQIAVVDGDEQITVWDARTGKRLRVIEGKHYLVAFSPDGRLGAVSCTTALRRLHAGKDVRIFEAGSFKKALDRAPHEGAVHALAFSPDGKEIATGSYEDKAGSIRFWDPTSGAERLAIAAPVGTLEKMLFSPQGEALAIAGQNCKPLIVDTRTGAVADEPRDPTHQAMFSPDGATLALVSAQTQLIDAQTGARRSVIDTGQSAAFSPDGRVLATVGKGIRLLDLETGETIAEYKTQGDPSDLAFLPDGKTLAARERDVVVLRDVATGKATKKLAVKGLWPSASTTSPDGGITAVGFDQQIVLFETKKGKAIATLEGHAAAIMALAFSPDGAWLAAASRKDIIVWDAAKRARAFAPSEATWASALAFSPDGAWLAAAQYGRISLYDGRSGELKGRRVGHQDSISSLAFSPDGRALVSTSDDTTAVVWTFEASAPAPRAAAPQATSAEAVGATDIANLVRAGTSQKVEKAKAKKANKEERRWPLLDGPVLAMATAGVDPPRAKAHDRLRAKGSFTFESPAKLEQGLQAFQSRAYIEYYSRDDWKVDGKQAFLDLATDIEVDCLTYGESFQRIAEHAAQGHVDLFYEDSVFGQRFMAGAYQASPVGPCVPPGAAARFGAPLGPSWGSQALAFTPDGARVLITRAGNVAVLDARTGNEQVSAHMGDVRHLVCLKDNQTVFVHGADEIALYDLATFTRQKRHGVSADLHAIAASPDGARVALGGNRKSIAVFDGALKPERTIEVPLSKGEEPYVDELAISPDGQRLAARLNRDRVMVWDLAAGSEVYAGRGSFSAVVFFDDRTLVVAGALFGKDDTQPKGADETLTWIDLESKKATRTIKAGKRAGRLLLTPDRQNIVCLESYQGVVSVIDTTEGKGRWRKEVSRDAGLSLLACSPDGQALVGATKHGRLQGFTVAAGDELYDHAYPILALASADKTGVLATLDESGELIVRDRKTGRTRLRGNIPLKATKNVHLSISADGRRLALADAIALQVLDVETGVWTDFEKNKLTAACFAQSKERLFTGHGDGLLRVWEGEPLSQVKEIKAAPSDLRRVIASADGARAAVSAKDGVIRIIDVASGECLRRFDASRDFAHALSMASDGSAVAGVRSRKERYSTHGEVVVWDVETGQARGVVHDALATALAFHPDGSLLAAAVRRFVILIDPRTGQRVGTLSGHLDEAHALAFSLDGRELWSAGADATTLVWDLGSLASMSFSHPSEHDGCHPWTRGLLAEWMR